MIPPLETFACRASSVRVLVVGDCMLDAYVTGKASRISPEAPVPVVNVGRRRYVPGGAANVAANARAMGAAVSLAGVVGSDDSNLRLRTALNETAIDNSLLVTDSSRSTTTKTRITAGGQQIVRFDDEDSSPLAPAIVEELRNGISIALASCNVCVISDYMKGVVREDLCTWLIGEANLRQVAVVVDPKALDFARYRGATVITPNLRETAAAAHTQIDSQTDLENAASRLLSAIGPSALLVTRGEDGMSLFIPGQPEHHLPAIVNEVADVTGAGDTVVAALAIALGAGFDLAEAAAIANVAAGVAVSHHGTWAVRTEELLALIPKARSTPVANGPSGPADPSVASA